MHGVLITPSERNIYQQLSIHSVLVTSAIFCVKPINYKQNRIGNLCLKKAQDSKIIEGAKVNVCVVLIKKFRWFFSHGCNCNLLRFGCFAAGQHVAGCNRHMNSAYSLAKSICYIRCILYPLLYGLWYTQSFVLLRVD